MFSFTEAQGLMYGLKLEEEKSKEDIKKDKLGVCHQHPLVG
jgi:hypothetical protein